ncbi:hypothetical protein ACHWQZ_G014126 [Mnemiopsis leidyi]
MMINLVLAFLPLLVHAANIRVHNTSWRDVERESFYDINLLEEVLQIRTASTFGSEKRVQILCVTHMRLKYIHVTTPQQYGPMTIVTSSEGLTVNCDKNSVLKIEFKKSSDTCRKTWNQEISRMFFTKLDNASVSYRVRRKVETGEYRNISVQNLQ